MDTEYSCINVCIRACMLFVLREVIMCMCECGCSNNTKIFQQHQNIRHRCECVYYTLCRCVGGYGYAFI